MPSSISPPEEYWSEPSDQVLSAMQSCPEGLAADEARRRKEEFGPNVLQEQKKQTPLGLLIRQFKSPIILLLLVATGISAGLGDWIDAIIILVIVLGSSALGFFQEYRANNAAEQLKQQMTFKTKVMREGQEQEVPVEDVVVGDILDLSAGSLVAADGVLIESCNLFADQAALTGETFPVEKDVKPVQPDTALAERKNCVFMGTSVTSGTGKAVVVKTGRQTNFGQIASKLEEEAPETEFQRGLRRFGTMLTWAMVALLIVITIANVAFGRNLLDSLLFALALAVGLTPQLLPAIVSVNLATGAQAMAKQGVIVRRLETIENFGSMDVFCTDKTGTLTEGVVQLNGAKDIEGNDSPAVLHYAYLNACFQTGLPNPLDQAILKKKVDTGNFERVDEIPYDFERKRLGVVVKEKAGSKRPLLIVKGALDKVVGICTQVQDQGAVVPLDKEHCRKVDRCMEDWSRQGFRVLGLATKQVEEKGNYTAEDEHDMVLEGYLLFFDPPKKGVRQTLADLGRMHVQLKLITGDNELVAMHVAQAVGLETGEVLEGPQLEKMSDEELQQVVEKSHLYASVDPGVKERIITALRKCGHVVGYMGDGINDTPALHVADVGISVQSAVDTAKEAADFVLNNPDLAVLHKGIIEGRTTFANTIKYIFMVAGTNFGNMFSVTIASFLVPFLPLLPKQILLQNLLTDGPQLTMARDNVDPVAVERPPRWNIAFIRNFMLVFGPLSSVFDVATFALLLWVMRARQDAFRTGWFIEAMLSATFGIYALRTRLPFFKNLPARSLFLAILIVQIISVALPYTPLASLLGFVPLPPFYVLIALGIVAAWFISAELVKRLFYRYLG